MAEDAKEKLLFLRDLANIEPPEDRYKLYDQEDIYKLVPKPQWTGLEEEIYRPLGHLHDPQLERVRHLLNKTGSIKDDPVMTDGTAAFYGAAAENKTFSEMTFGGKVKHLTSKLLNKNWFEIFMMTTTFWALFAEDARLACFEREQSDSADYAFWGISLGVCILFAIELCMRTGAQKGYPYSFYFWLDIVAVASMVPDFLPLCFPDNPYQVSTGLNPNPKPNPKPSPKPNPHSNPNADRASGPGEHVGQR